MTTSRSIRNLVFTALFAALFIALSAVKIPLSFSSVPITLQNLAVMLAGAFLGARLGFSSITIVLLLAATGLPLLHGQGGLAYMTGGTGGFLLAFPFAALAIGYFVGKILNSRIASNRIATIILLFLVFEGFGSLATYVLGVPWLMHVYDMTFARAMTAGCYPFLPLDAFKAAAATAITMSLLPFLSISRPQSSPQQSLQTQTGTSR
ncbi:biotin transporter BioY [Paenibacillus sp. MMS18-CY102]|uniref:biotin transporter BioY n=1 Tax=Paenibacillus sp. MMS18-CY102 TaxID=2682849 RepID=UPI0013655D81|nr:biotin transporter BioY [Paenibacillus sp. MMS18-CY102]MWC26483.1 biotin transporter BioY [Paenibacillus sp. MMS18-CY102]